MSLFFASPNEVSQKLGERLKAKRLAQNMTQAGLALRAGLSVGSLKRFESTGQVSLRSMLSISLVLGCLDECKDLFAETAKPATLFKEEKRQNRKRGRIK